jgi:hypothetical protein
MLYPPRRQIKQEKALPHDPVAIDHDVVIGDHGQHDSVVIKNYIAPATADCGIAHDPYKDDDFALAEQVRRYLTTRFPVGYLWCVDSDLAHGIVKFSIPILMGVSNWWVINLRTTDLAKGVLQGAGEILERYLLPRDKFSLAAFLDARARHSALVVPGRKVPH